MTKVSLSSPSYSMASAPLTPHGAHDDVPVSHVHEHGYPGWTLRVEKSPDVW